MQLPAVGHVRDSLREVLVRWNGPAVSERNTLRITTAEGMRPARNYSPPPTTQTPRHRKKGKREAPGGASVPSRAHRNTSPHSHHPASAPPACCVLQPQHTAQYAHRPANQPQHQLSMHGVEAAHVQTTTRFVQGQIVEGVMHALHAFCSWWTFAANNSAASPRSYAAAGTNHVSPPPAT